MMLIFVTLLLSFSNIMCEDGYFVRYYGGYESNVDVFTDIISFDGGFYLYGYSQGEGTQSNSFDFTLSKFKDSGAVEWTKVFGNPGVDHSFRFVQSEDGTFLVCGTENGGGFLSSVSAAEDGEFTINWSTKITNGMIDNFNSISEDSENGYVYVVGEYIPMGRRVIIDYLGSPGELVLQKFDSSSGTLEYSRWSNVATYWGSKGFLTEFVEVLNDGSGVIVIGSFKWNAPTRSLFLWKLSHEGKTLLFYDIGITIDDENSIRSHRSFTLRDQTEVIIVGQSEEEVNCGFVANLKIDSDGIINEEDPTSSDFIVNYFLKFCIDVDLVVGKGEEDLDHISFYDGAFTEEEEEGYIWVVGKYFTSTYAGYGFYVTLKESEIPKTYEVDDTNNNNEGVIITARKVDSTLIFRSVTENEDQSSVIMVGRLNNEDETSVIIRPYDYDNEICESIDYSSDSWMYSYVFNSSEIYVSNITKVIDVTTSDHPTGDAGITTTEILDTVSTELYCISCFGYGVQDVEFVCNTKGICIGANNCSCYEYYHGEECKEFECHGVLSTDVENVCGNSEFSMFSVGSCIGPNLCRCTEGYYSSTEEGGVCDDWYCGKYLKNEAGVCNEGKGVCVSSEVCDCSISPGYEGEECEIWRCGNLEYSDPRVCSNGHGKCVAPQTCECSSSGKYIGSNCQTSMYYYTVMTPLLSVSSTFALFVVVMGLACLCLCVYGVCCCFVCVSGCLCCGILKQRRGIKKFEQLHDFDFYLKEQELSRDNQTAHLKINKSLFEIPFEELKMESILGGDGGGSIVYKCKWKNTGKFVAFKCFKTTRLCESQDCFSLFEKELKFMASLSHPNVVQFYGATLKPPRVGIVMEYCENGEIVKFLKNRKNKYSVIQKLRCFREISSAMTYIHGLDVIHRDLKSANVLVNSKEVCKVMDFGASRSIDRSNINNLTKRIGTSFYMAPEIVLGESDYDQKCDVYSFAILMFIMMTENENPYESFSKKMKEPIEDDEEEEKDWKVRENVTNIEFKVSQDSNFRPDLNEIISDENSDEGEEVEWIKKIIQRCWDHDPQKRYSFKELQNMIVEKISSSSSTKFNEMNVLVINHQKKEEVEDVSIDIHYLKNENKKLMDRLNELEQLKKRLLDSDTESEEEEEEDGDEGGEGGGEGEGEGEGEEEEEEEDDDDDDESENYEEED